MIRSEHIAEERLEGHQVLVVEDEALLAMDMADQVERAGGGCEMAASAREALRLLGRRRFDAAILDFQLLDGNSLPVAAELLARHVPFFFVTAQGELPQLRECHPDVRIFSKPLMPHRMRRELVRTLRVGPVASAAA